MKKKIFVGLFFLVISFPAFAQNRSIIIGTVTNGKTGNPMPNVNVFLSKTTLGKATDHAGHFVINNIPRGTYNLVFSYVGFKTKIKQTNLLLADSVHYSVRLSPTINKLKETYIEADNKEWRKNLALFKKKFIGTDQNARQTTITNPEVLHFKWKDHNTAFYATASEPLKIKNKALGYSITVILKKFIYRQSNYNRSIETTFYNTYPHYREMKTKNGFQKIRWIKNRKGTYLGSKQQFFKSLYAGNLSEQGFDIEQGAIHKLDKMKKNNIFSRRQWSTQFNKDVKAYKYMIHSANNNQPLIITYKNREVGALLQTKKNILLISKYGRLLNANAVLTGGGWHRNRFADFLPRNYSLPD